MKIVWHLFAIAFALLSALTARGETKVIRRAGDIAGVSMMDATPHGIPFDIEARVIYPKTVGDGTCDQIYVKDESGAANLQNYLPKTNETIRAGDLVRATGRIVMENNGIYAHCLQMVFLAHGNPETPRRLTIGELLSERHDGQIVTVRGEVCDAFRDEIDVSFCYFILKDGDKSIYMAANKNVNWSARRDDIIGNTVEATGVWIQAQNSGTRRYIGHILHLKTVDSLRTVKARKHDIFDAPEINLCAVNPQHSPPTPQPYDVPPLERRRIIGTVLAAWHGDHALVKTDDGSIVRLDLSSPPSPKAGRRIEAIGFPETDLYAVNLNHAKWRPADGKPLPSEQPFRLDEDPICNGVITPQQIQAALHGRIVIVRGIVRSLPQSENDRRLTLECENMLLPIDFTPCPDAISGIAIGCTVEIGGVWVMEAENWRPNAVFPRIKGAFVVVNSSDGLRVLERPSWWTAGRSLTVIGLLLAIMLGIVIWNRSLHTLAERRGRELTKETVSRVESELKVSERTRLAVELHDTLAQYLTGTIMEIRTGSRLSGALPPAAQDHFALAQKTLESCRQELRNCLWDLRNRALELPTMDAAIRQTLAPHVKNIDLNVRFAVPRETISDNTAHAILRIIRELVTNALRHGHATALKVAGAVEGGKLHFSVKDNGCGFSPESAPGIEDGHFGLQGIRERIAPFNGDFKIESASGKGAKATVSLTLPHTVHASQPDNPSHSSHHFQGSLP